MTALRCTNQDRLGQVPIDLRDKGKECMCAEFVDKPAHLLNLVSS